MVISWFWVSVAHWNCLKSTASIHVLVLGLCFQSRGKLQLVLFLLSSNWHLKLMISGTQVLPLLRRPVYRQWFICVCIFVNIMYLNCLYIHLYVYIFYNNIHTHIHILYIHTYKYMYIQSILQLFLIKKTDFIHQVHFERMKNCCLLEREIQYLGAVSPRGKKWCRKSKWVLVAYGNSQVLACMPSVRFHIVLIIFDRDNGIVRHKKKSKRFLRA